MSLITSAEREGQDDNIYYSDLIGRAEAGGGRGGGGGGRETLRSRSWKHFDDESFIFSNYPFPSFSVPSECDFQPFIILITDLRLSNFSNIFFLHFDLLFIDILSNYKSSGI